MTFQAIAAGAGADVRCNDNFDAVAQSGLFGKKNPTTTGLTWGYYGGQFAGTTIADGTVALTDNSTNYVVALISTGVVSASTATTNWASVLYLNIAMVVTSGGTISSWLDYRQAFGATWGSITGTLANQADLTAALATKGAVGIPQNAKSAAYTLVLSDANKHILHPAADTTARIFTMPANSSVAFPIGTVITFVNQNAGGVITIAITTDTLRLAGAGTTGSRTLAANGIATALKITSTEWIIYGTGLT